MGQPSVRTSIWEAEIAGFDEERECVLGLPRVEPAATEEIAAVPALPFTRRAEQDVPCNGVLGNPEPVHLEGTEVCTAFDFTQETALFEHGRRPFQVLESDVYLAEQGAGAL